MALGWSEWLDASGSGGEDAALDSQISSEDPSNDLVLIPGYAEAVQSEALRDMPLVWFPILGENRLAQVRKVEELFRPEQRSVRCCRTLRAILGVG